MAKPRRERDETRVFKNMGKALGFGASIEPKHVKETKAGLMKDARNMREDRRVERAKSGFAASSRAAWEESQREEGPRQVIKIESNK